MRRKLINKYKERWRRVGVRVKSYVCQLVEMAPLCIRVLNVLGIMAVGMIDV